MAHLPDLRQRLKGGIFYTLPLIAAFVCGYFNPTVLLSFFLACGFLMGRELGQVIIPENSRHNLVALGILSVLPAFFIRLQGCEIPASALAFAGIAALGIFFYVLFMLLASLIRYGPEILVSGVLISAGTFYIWFPLSLVYPLLYIVPHGFQWLVLAVLAPALTDVCAYFGGVLFGRRKIVPNISPKKTIAGFLSGTVGALIVTSIFFFLRPGIKESYHPTIVISALAAVSSAVIFSLTSQFGDWLASAIKRTAGIKDFGSLFAGHGGLLDRLDSFLFSLPFVFVTALLVESFVFGGILP